jgi:hypothetical protein
MRTVPEPQSIPEVLADLKDLTVIYARQETIEPLRSLGRFFKLGGIGVLLVGIGVVELTLFVLRVLQTETGTALTGSWSWVPYLVAILFVALVAGVFVYLIVRHPKEAGR